MEKEINLNRYINSIGKEVIPSLRTTKEFKEKVNQDTKRFLAALFKSARHVAAKNKHVVSVEIAERIIKAEIADPYTRSRYLKAGERSMYRYRSYKDRPKGSPRLSIRLQTGQHIPLSAVKKMMKKECHPCKLDADAAAYMAGVVDIFIEDIFSACEEYLGTLKNPPKTLSLEILKNAK